jgi:DNA polymerase-3 subunit delta
LASAGLYVFELQKAFVNRDILKANRIILYFAENKKNNPLVLVLARFSIFLGICFCSIT